MIRGLLLLVPALAVAADAAPPIRAGDVALSRAAIARRAADVRAKGAQLTPDQLVDGLIDEVVLAAEARRTGIDKDPQIRATLEVDAARILAEFVTDTEIAAAVSPTEEALRALFHQMADTVELEIVVLATKEEAAAARARLDGGGEFALEAARSLDPNSARSKGRTGPLSRMLVAPALVQSAFAEPVGRIFGPVELDKGWAVARVLTRSVGDEATYAKRRPELVPTAKKRALAGAREHYLDGLRKRSKATVDEQFLKSFEKRVSATAAELDHDFARIDGQGLKYRELLPSILALAAGRNSSHMLGSPVRIQLAWRVVDDRLLARDARARGTDKDPGVRAATVNAEIRVLATAMADKIAAGLPAGTSQEKTTNAIRRRIKELRAQLDLKVDRDAARAAAAGDGSASK